MSEHKSNYTIALLLNILSLFVLIAGVLFVGYTYLYLDHKELNEFRQIITVPGPSKKQTTTAFVIATICVLQYVFLKIPLKKYMDKAIQDNEYDEFGRNKKKTVSNLSRQEREKIDAERTAQMEMLLPTSVMKKITKKGAADPDKELNELIGLASVKQKVAEMTARMKFDMENYKLAKKKHDKNAVNPKGKNGRHYVFYGNPGTGKTTVARIFAGYLYKYGYIKENKVIEINGGFLKAGDMSEEKTKMVIQQAYGGVLFIDEAYSIMDGNPQYGRAVIAELIKEMEDNRDKFTVILAGYKNDMKRLVDTNEGFKSRVKEYLEFPDYNAVEMQDIFRDMAGSAGFAVDAGAMENFDERIIKERQLSSFGNGRTARSILDECLDKHATNFGMNDLAFVDENGMEHQNEESRYILRAKDVSTSINKAVL